MLKLTIELDDINYDKLADKLSHGGTAAKMALALVPDDKKDAVAAKLLNEAKVPVIRAIQGMLRDEDLEALILAINAEAE